AAVAPRTCAAAIPWRWIPVTAAARHNAMHSTARNADERTAIPAAHRNGHGDGQDLAAARRGGRGRGAAAAAGGVADVGCGRGGNGAASGVSGRTGVDAGVA